MDKRRGEIRRRIFEKYMMGRIEESYSVTAQKIPHLVGTGHHVIEILAQVL